VRSGPLPRLLLLAAAIAACRSGPPPNAEREIVVFAAASLLGAFQDLGRELERTNPGITVRFNAAGSQQLARQLVQGAPGDVFASADDRWMRFADARGLTESPALLAQNRLLAVFADRPGLERMTLLNLASPGITVVLGAPEVPLGRYARQSLRRLSGAPGFGADFAARVEQGVVSREASAAAVIAKVRLGEADAAIVYASDVTAADTTLRQVPIPPALNVTADYHIAVLRGAADSSLARAFVTLALSERGQEILARHGLMRADAATR
jgi:molybdate transport system substrate-binding protein